MNIYVGNLSYDLTEEDLRIAFEPFGNVEYTKIIKDMNTGKSRGFGFVKMPVKHEAESAIGSLNGSLLKGRALRVSEARPRSQERREPRLQGSWRRV